MVAPWPSEEARERYIKYLELELKLMKCASERRIDPELLGELDELMKEWFPKTTSLVQRGGRGGAGAATSDEIRAVAWAEARSIPADGEKSRVQGVWTEQEIAEDINECFRIARERAGI